MKNPEDLNLDRPVWGAEAIAKEANLFDDEGKADVRKAYYLLEFWRDRGQTCEGSRQRG